MLSAVQAKPWPFPTPLRPPSAPPKDDETPPEPLDKAIAEAQPAIAEAVAPVLALTQGIEMTAPENKAIADKVSAFSERVRVMGAEVHPFVSYESMFEAWLGASPFHQSSETRDVAPLLPGLKYKGVHEVVSQNYKVVHAVAAEGWNKSIVAPKFSRIRTDYDKAESIPTEVIYLCEDPKGNRLVVEMRREWSNQPPTLTVFAHDNQPQLITEFYDKLNDWTGQNNFYKNKVLQYVEPPHGPALHGFPGRPEDEAHHLGGHRAGAEVRGIDQVEHHRLLQGIVHLQRKWQVCLPQHPAGGPARDRQVDDQRHPHPGIEG